MGEEHNLEKFLKRKKEKRINKVLSDYGTSSWSGFIADHFVTLDSRSGIRAMIVSRSMRGYPD